MTRFLPSLVLLLGAAVLLTGLTSCATGSSTALRPITTAPKELKLATATVVDTGFSGGRIFLPAGAYRAIGENEKDVFYASPTGIGTRFTPESLTAFAASDGKVGTMVPGGVCVRLIDATATGVREMTSHTTWKAKAETPQVPEAVTPAQPGVTFSLPPAVLPGDPTPAVSAPEPAPVPEPSAEATPASSVPASVPAPVPPPSAP